VTELPTGREQIIRTHARLITAVVQAVGHDALPQELEHALQVSAQNGWTALVRAIRRILAGERVMTRLGPMDEEDATICEAILRGVQDPATLPDPNQQPDPSLAAPGLAQLIHEAGTGHTQALQALASLAEQMTRVDGDMGRLGGLMKRLVDGERDPERLGRGLTAQGRSLLLAILESLGRLESH